jgi:hypothetical protein
MAKQVPNKSHAAEPVAAALQRSSQPLADLTAAQLALWRGGADFVRVLLRTQQNQMLSLWRVQAMALGNGQPPTLERFLRDVNRIGDWGIPFGPQIRFDCPFGNGGAHHGEGVFQGPA